jgi:hypothetical protein
MGTGVVRLATKGIMTLVNSVQYAAVFEAVVRDAHKILVQFCQKPLEKAFQVVVSGGSYLSNCRPCGRKEYPAV